MSKIISLNVFLEYNSFRYIISGDDNKGYKGRADRIMRFAYVKAEAATFDSCRILMENKIDSYLTNQYLSEPVIVVQGEVSLTPKSAKIGPLDFDQLDRDMNEIFNSKSGNNAQKEQREEQA